MKAKEDAHQRTDNMLSSALGEAAAAYLKDPEIVELMLNDDGALWIDRLGEGRAYTGHNMSESDAERTIYIVASSVKAICNKDSPVLSAELPSSGYRFQGMLPPIVERPVFAIRKRAIRVFTLKDYVDSNILAEGHKKTLVECVRKKKNILIAGGTGSGKTTFANALLHEISLTGDRLVIIEDTRELQCIAEDSVSLRTKEGVADMTDLLRATMRLRPDRIIIGEVRGPEALTMLKAWNTGHPGGIATVHADSAEKALSRIEQLLFEAGLIAPKTLIAEAINIIVFIEKTKTSRQVSEIVSLSLKKGDYDLRAVP